jgi:DNA-binding transcriptional LysR family regulator
MYEGPEFRHLVSFVAVAEECSFGGAAKRIRVAQPSLSAQIKQIEEGLGVSLFIRSQTGASLTASGRQFLVFARLMLQMREHSVRATASDKTGTEWPLRFGYSPFADHWIVEEARSGYLELVPGGHIQTSSDCSAELTTMVADGRLDAAIVTLPLAEKGLFIHPICEERMLVCLRCDDPLAASATLPQDVIAARLCILFARVHQPSLYDQIVRTLAQAGIALNPSEFISAPAEMQYLVKRGKGFSLAQESTNLDPELTMRGITGINLTVRVMAPTLFALTFAALLTHRERWTSPGLNAHGDVQDVRHLCGRCHLFRRSDLRRHSDDERSLPGCHSGSLRCAVRCRRARMGRGMDWLTSPGSRCRGDA